MTQTALITGGQQGIGLGIARALHAAGWRIAFMSERPGDDPAVKEALALMPGSIHVTHDIADTDHITAAVDEVEELNGPISTFVSNAGVPAMVRGDLLSMSQESFDRCMSINLRGAFFLIQEIAQRMLKQRADDYKSIHVVTSVSAGIVSPDRAEYCMSKAAASMMTKALAARLAPDGVGVFELRPGIIRTPMTGPVSDRYDARIADGLVPSGRWGEPEDIGKVIVPLARGDFDFATGSVIPVDGGLSIHRL